MFRDRLVLFGVVLCVFVDVCVTHSERTGGDDEKVSSLYFNITYFMV